MVCFLNFHTR